MTSAWLLGAAPNATFRRLAGDIGSESAHRASGDSTKNKSNDASTDLASPQPRSGVYVASAGLGLIVICAAITALLRHRPRRADKLTTDLVEEQLSSNCPRFVEKRQRILRVLTHNMQRLAQNQINVGDLMTTSPASVSPSASVAELRELMQREEIRHLLVCDGTKLVGVVSDRDLRGAQARTVKQIMSVHPVTIPTISPIVPAVTLMLERYISCLPVMDDDRVVGIFTTTDAAMALQCMSQILQQWADERMAEPAPAALASYDPALSEVG
jgi:predicted transcriptional regulator